MYVLHLITYVYVYAYRVYEYVFIYVYIYMYDGIGRYRLLCYLSSTYIHIYIFVYTDMNKFILNKYEMKVINEAFKEVTDQTNSDNPFRIDSNDRYRLLCYLSSTYIHIYIFIYRYE
jgi:hypothetical protein